MDAQPAQPVSIELDQLRFSWRKKALPAIAINTLTVHQGERIFLHGPSGSGKSTLLSLLAGVQQPQSGRLLIQGHGLHQLAQSKRDRFRADHIGYIFQQFNLLPFLDLVHNVTLACEFSKARRERLASKGLEPEKAAAALLERLGIPTHMHHRRAYELSVGQQQRVAAARALLGYPPLLIADEPTSALDANSRESFLKLLFEACKEANTTLIFVSHDHALAPIFSRSIDLTTINQVPGVHHEFN